MFSFLFKLKGNAKPCILVEPLWGIPMNLYTPFVALFMFSLGLGDTQIGLILSIGLASQVVFAFIGGVVTDKYGRRKTTFIAEFFAWSIPTLLWAFSQNFWWFVAAAVFNGVRNITLVSFECLWVDEEAEERKVTMVFNWIFICGLLSVFFAPLAGYFVQVQGVVPVMRVLYIFAFVSMSAKFTLLYIFSKETERGKERMEATKNTSLFRLLWGYKDVFAQIFRSREMVKAMVLMALEGITIVIITGFFALYATQNLDLPEVFLAYFPILRAVVMLIFMLGIQNKFNRYNTIKVMLAGLLLYVAAFSLLLSAPAGNWLWIAAFVVIDACASALFLPRMRGLAAHLIEPEERARIRSLFHVVVLAVSTPFGALAGVLADINRQLPFILVLGIFVVMVVFTGVGFRDKKAAAPL
ncbi:MAG: MFS transporter [Defluviitaleaceae bacterium]|nr:MFS transporter [Defluviitaleaceae bacterium]